MNHAIVWRHTDWTQQSDANSRAGLNQNIVLNFSFRVPDCRDDGPPYVLYGVLSNSPAVAGVTSFCRASSIQNLRSATEGRC